MSKQTITTIVVAVVFLAGGFFGGYKYSQSKAPTPGQRAAGAFGAAGAAGRAGGRAGFGTGNNFVNGTILSNDNGTLTIQMRALPGSATSTNSGSKIVVLSDNTQIFKAVQGTPADLSVGQSVTVTGTDNSAGALTAQTIQIRQMPPAGQDGQTPPPAGQ